MIELDLEEAKSIAITMKRAEEKLVLYRKQHSGEYVGGMEFSMLIEDIVGLRTFIERLCKVAEFNRSGNGE